MFRIGRVTCMLCKLRVRRRDARKAQDGSAAHVCADGYSRWDAEGRQCAACHSQVRGIQDVGLVPQKGLGHADCGGVRMLRA